MSLCWVYNVKQEMYVRGISWGAFSMRRYSKCSWLRGFMSTDGIKYWKNLGLTCPTDQLPAKEAYIFSHTNALMQTHDSETMKKAPFTGGMENPLSRRAHQQK